MYSPISRRQTASLVSALAPRPSREVEFDVYSSTFVQSLVRSDSFSCV